jgi:hypothetical protein
MSTTIRGLFEDLATARAAAADLETVGVPHGAISIIGSDPEGHVIHDQGASPEQKAAGAGAALGGVLGGGAGLLAALGTIAIPGLGPLVAAGPIVAALASAGIGAAGGGLMGTLVGLGIPDHEADVYAEGLRRGSAIVVASVDPSLEPRVLAVMDRHRRHDVQEQAARYGAEGWTRAGLGDAARGLREADRDESQIARSQADLTPPRR